MKIYVLRLILKVKKMLIRLPTHNFKILTERLVLNQLGEHNTFSYNFYLFILLMKNKLLINYYTTVLTTTCVRVRTRTRPGPDTGPGPIQVQVQVQSCPDLDLRSGSGVRKKRLDRTWTGPWTV